MGPLAGRDAVHPRTAYAGPVVTEEEELAGEFETQRSYLHAIAFRMLGSHADADDAVQEAWLRLGRTGGDGIEDLRGWLTTVTSRICLDALCRRGVRGEQPLELSVGILPLEAAGDPRSDPESRLSSAIPSASRCTSLWTPSPRRSGCRSYSTTCSRSRSTRSPPSSTGALRPPRCWPAGSAATALQLLPRLQGHSMRPTLLGTQLLYEPGPKWIGTCCSAGRVAAPNRDTPIIPSSVMLSMISVSTLISVPESFHCCYAGVRGVRPECGRWWRVVGGSGPG